jgi:hypothetical protein
LVSEARDPGVSALRQALAASPDGAVVVFVDHDVFIADLQRPLSTFYAPRFAPGEAVFMMAMHVSEHDASERAAPPHAPGMVMICNNARARDAVESMVHVNDKARGPLEFGQGIADHIMRLTTLPFHVVPQRELLGAGLVSQSYGAKDVIPFSLYVTDPLQLRAIIKASSSNASWEQFRQQLEMTYRHARAGRRKQRLW